MSDNIKMPGVYRGTQKLATQEDLANLRQELKRLITGPLAENTSSNGYIPWKFNDDGTLDVEYLFPELLQKFDEDTGITITKDGVKLTSEIKTINFTGNYVYFDVDESGNITLDIRAPKQEVSKFNTLDGVTDSLVKIENEIVTDMIVPDTTAIDENPIYGDWIPGSKCEGFNWNGNDYFDPLVLSTNGPVWAIDNETYFEVFIYNGYNEVIAQYITKPVTGNTSENGLAAISTGHNYNIKVIISNCKEEPKNNESPDEPTHLSFKPKFEINMIGIFGKSGSRFHVKIVHHNGIYVNEYVSQDYLYNVGRIPQLINPYYDIVTNNLVASKPLVASWCSGLKYITQAEISFNIQEVRYLNHYAAKDDKISFSFENIDNNVTSGTAKLNNYDLTVNNTPSWSVTLYPDKEIFVNEETSGYVVASNSFGDSDKLNITVNMLINSKTDLKVSDDLNEYFNTEDKRVSNEFTASISNGLKTLVKWNSGRSLKDEDDGSGLMVIPTSGLLYPFGDWTGFIPAGSPNYNDFSFLSREKYFSRVFTGNNDLKFGGIFHFEGISRDEFLDSRISCVISPDQGLNWYSLKTIRNKREVITKNDGSLLEVTGVLTNVIDVEGGVDVFWSYPETICSRNPIYFRIGFKPSSPFIIKAISLKGLDGHKEW